MINKGKVLCSGRAEEIKRHPDVRREYLGNMDEDQLGDEDELGDEAA